MEKRIGLTPDQFHFDLDGNVVIDHDEVTQVVRCQEATTAVPPPELAIGISIEIG
jgi:hypothetical protein